jgi:hypothetical protein
MPTTITVDGFYDPMFDRLRTMIGQRVDWVDCAFPDGGGVLVNVERVAQKIANGADIEGRVSYKLTLDNGLEPIVCF